MAFWAVIALVVLLLLAAMVIYMVHVTGKFSFVKKLSQGKRATRRIISTALNVFLLAVLTFTMSFVNAVVIYIHLGLFLMLFELVFKLVPKEKRESFKVYWPGILALAATVVVTLVGIYLCFNVWQTNYTLTTSKSIAPVRIALIADSHLGTTMDGEEFASYMEEIEAQHPDMLIIAGDFIDDASPREDMVRACEALGEMDLPYGVYYAYGNHDRGYYDDGTRGAELAANLEANGVQILQDQIAYVGDIVIVGREDASWDRQEISDLLTGIDESRYIVVIDHEPTDYENEAATSADLVLSGHTHGGQLFPLTLMGKLFGNDGTYGLMNINGTDFIVTSGISNWELLMKTGTRSEYVIIDIG